MAPIRETQQDRDREAAIARRLQQSFGWLLVKMPPQYRVDYGIKAEGGEGQLQGFVEVKSRNGYWSDLDGVVFNLGKLYAMR